ncbi:hypothetical protein [Listeria costaricensis]|uniref:hypothetical protein n=1 Tax=Listeria costaricensis TaxID=2026604 RepID=UPI0013C477F6|nr:hypothetical protein [Listeria costaricensis]
MVLISDGFSKLAAQYTEQQGIEALPRPWLPPLEERIPLSNISITNFEEAWQKEEKDLNIILGMLDQSHI